MLFRPNLHPPFLSEVKAKKGKLFFPAGFCDFSQDFHKTSLTGTNTLEWNFILLYNTFLTFLLIGRNQKLVSTKRRVPLSQSQLVHKGTIGLSTLYICLIILKFDRPGFTVGRPIRWAPPRIHRARGILSLDLRSPIVRPSLCSIAPIILSCFPFISTKGIPPSKLRFL